MKLWITTLVGAVAIMQMNTATAGDSPWSLRLGASYRDFKDLSFESTTFRNSGTDANSTGPYGIQNTSAAPGNPIFAPVILDYVSYNGGSREVDDNDKLAPMIGWRFELNSAAGSNLHLALVSNFQYFNIDTSSSANGSSDAPGEFSDAQFEHYVVDAFGTLIPGAPLVGNAPGTTFSIRNQFDMDLYVMDFGLEARATMGWFNLTFAIGPTMTIYNADSSQTQQASYGDQGPGLPAGSYSQTTHDSETKVLPGAYAAVGMAIDLSNEWSIGAEVRYDYVNSDAGTDQAKLDLTSASGIVSVAYKF